MLALRGQQVHFPGVDHGYDLLMNHGVRVQVKSAMLKDTYYASCSYNFHLRKCAYARSNKNIMPARTRTFSEECDFVVLWGVDEDRFWVAPANLLDGVHFLTVAPKIWRKNVDIEEIRRMAADGKTHEEIARHFSCSRTTISRRLQGQFTDVKFQRCITVRNNENRWDLIEVFVSERERLLYPEPEIEVPASVVDIRASA